MSYFFFTDKIMNFYPSCRNDTCFPFSCTYLYIYIDILVHITYIAVHTLCIKKLVFRQNFNEFLIVT